MPSIQISRSGLSRRPVQEIEEEEEPIILHPPPHSNKAIGGFVCWRRTTPSARSRRAQEINPSYKPTGPNTKALEKQLEELRTQEQKLLQQGDSMMNTLAVNTQILVRFSTTVKSLFPENHPQTRSCGKLVLGVALITSFSFVLGYALTLAVVVHKLKRLSWLAPHLRSRRENVQRDSLEFLIEFLDRGIHPPPTSPSLSLPNSPYAIVVSRARIEANANTQSLDSSFGRRINGLIEDPSGVSKFCLDYKCGLIVFTILSVLYGIYYPLVFTYLRFLERV